MSDQGGVIPRRLLGRELKSLREKRGSTLEDVSADLLISTSKLSRLETGLGLPQKRDVRELAKYYDLDEIATEEMLAWVEASRKRPPWQEIVPPPTNTYLSYESAAKEIDLYSARLVPSLLHTEPYAATVLRAESSKVPADIDNLIEVHLRRKEIWLRPENPVRLNLILDESALLRQVGSRQVMADQVRYIEQVLDERHSITLQIVELSSGPHWSSHQGSFTIFRFDHDRLTTAVNFENQDKYFMGDETAASQFLDRFDALSDLALSSDDSRIRLREVANARYQQ